MVSNFPSLIHFIILCSSHSKVRFNIFMISAFIIYVPLNLISKIKLGKLFYIVKNNFEVH